MKVYCFLNSKFTKFTAASEYIKHTHMQFSSALVFQKIRVGNKQERTTATAGLEPYIALK